MLTDNVKSALALEDSYLLRPRRCDIAIRAPSMPVDLRWKRLRAVLRNQVGEHVAPSAVAALLGSGTSAAVVDIYSGEVFLGRGSRADTVVLIAARRVQ